VADRAVAAPEVHLWWAALRVPPERLARLEALLTGDERTRADRFRFARDRARFVAARGTLREILGRYLDREPAALRFAYGAHGKPALAETSTGLRFNLAHSGDAALFAVRWERDIGVDLEPARTDLDLGELAAIVLTPGERALLAAAPPDRRHELFAALWTRKEALAKATGLGLALPFDRVAAAPLGDLADWIEPDGPFLGDRRWSLRSLDVGPGFAAALAVEGDGVEVRDQTTVMPVGM